MGTQERISLLYGTSSAVEYTRFEETTIIFPLIEAKWRKRGRKNFSPYTAECKKGQPTIHESLMRQRDRSKAERK